MIAYLESEIQKPKTEIDKIKKKNEKRVDYTIQSELQIQWHFKILMAAFIEIEQTIL